MAWLRTPKLQTGSTVLGRHEIAGTARKALAGNVCIARIDGERVRTIDATGWAIQRGTPLRRSTGINFGGDEIAKTGNAALPRYIDVACAIDRKRILARLT